MEITSVPMSNMMYPYKWLMKWRLYMSRYTATCIATPGSRQANRNNWRIRLFPTNLKRFKTYASWELMMIEPASTNTSTTPEFQNACPMCAAVNAFLKLLNAHTFGGCMTALPVPEAVLSKPYSASDLNAVIKHDTSGSNVKNAKNTRMKYFRFVQIVCAAAYFDTAVS